MSAGRWVRVARAVDVPPGTGKHFRVAGRDLAVFNDREVFFVTDDACPHQGASLAEGAVHEGIVTCPWHGWSFGLRSGSCVHAPGVAVGTYLARRRGDRVEAKIPEPSGNGEWDAGQESE